MKVRQDWRGQSAWNPGNGPDKLHRVPVHQRNKKGYDHQRQYECNGFQSRPLKHNDRRYRQKSRNGCIANRRGSNEEANPKS